MTYINTLASTAASNIIRSAAFAGELETLFSVVLENGDAQDTLSDLAENHARRMLERSYLGDIRRDMPEHGQEFEDTVIGLLQTLSGLVFEALAEEAEEQEEEDGATYEELPEIIGNELAEALLELLQEALDNCESYDEEGVKELIAQEYEEAYPLPESAYYYTLDVDQLWRDSYSEVIGSRFIRIGGPFYSIDEMIDKLADLDD